MIELIKINTNELSVIAEVEPAETIETVVTAGGVATVVTESVVTIENPQNKKLEGLDEELIENPQNEKPEKPVKKLLRR